MIKAMKHTRSEKQLLYDKERATLKKWQDKNIEKEYKQLVKKNYAKGFIINYLRQKYKTRDGKISSVSRIYDAIDSRKIKRETCAAGEQQA
jgi:hypothetical protein